MAFDWQIIGKEFVIDWSEILHYWIFAFKALKVDIFALVVLICWLIVDFKFVVFEINSFVAGSKKFKCEVKIFIHFPCRGRMWWTEFGVCLYLELDVSALFESLYPLSSLRCPNRPWYSSPCLPDNISVKW